MLAYLLLILKTGLDATNSALSKSFQRNFDNTTLNFTKYNLTNSLFASVFLFILNGFRLNVNLPTFIYSAVFALTVALNIILMILALGKTTMPMVYIISTSGGVIISTLFSAVVLQDIPSAKAVIAVFLLLAAVLLSYEISQSKNSKYSFFIYLLFFIDNGAVMVITKLYTLDTRVCDEKSFCLLTNLIIAAVCVIILPAFLLSKKSTVKEIVKPFSIKQTLNIFSRTILSNLDSLVMIWAVALMNLSVFSVATSALTIIATTLLSLIIFKEKLSKKQLISTLLALAAIILGI
ncbi:MAG: hypothetical protein IJY93_04915 [Clostridia bacterium]|nr:hypothetical protein [Clostridia bacterium]